jgi:hypothetical protein
LKVCVIIAAAMDGWGHAALRRQQRHGGDVGPILQEFDARDYPKWKDISDCSLNYKLLGSVELPGGEK